jgi:hypothetical protein
MARRLPYPVRMTRTRAHTFLFVILLVATASIAMAADSIMDGPRRQIRTTDARLRRLLDDGVRRSHTFRALVERVEASDVVVYVRCDNDGPNAPDGRLTFLSSAGGYRYVVVRLNRRRWRVEQIAIMAHELRHAVEIADTPAIVDGASLVREYKRIGYEKHGMKLAGIAFDSQAAVDAGTQVLNELMAEDD